jgi:hypothetical protein
MTFHRAHRDRFARFAATSLRIFALLLAAGALGNEHGVLLEGALQPPSGRAAAPRARL